MPRRAAQPTGYTARDGWTIRLSTEGYGYIAVYRPSGERDFIERGSEWSPITPEYAQDTFNTFRKRHDRVRA